MIDVTETPGGEREEDPGGERRRLGRTPVPRDEPRGEPAEDEAREEQYVQHERWIVGREVERRDQDGARHVRVGERERVPDGMEDVRVEEPRRRRDERMGDPSE